MIQLLTRGSPKLPVQVGTLALLGACYDREVKGVVDLDRFSDLLKTQEKYRERTRDRLEFNLAMGRWIKAIPPGVEGRREIKLRNNRRPRRGGEGQVKRCREREASETRGGEVEGRRVTGSAEEGREHEALVRHPSIRGGS